MEGYPPIAVMGGQLRMLQAEEVNEEVLGRTLATVEKTSIEGTLVCTGGVVVGECTHGAERFRVSVFGGDRPRMALMNHVKLEEKAQGELGTKGENEPIVSAVLTAMEWMALRQVVMLDGYPVLGWRSGGLVALGIGPMREGGVARWVKELRPEQRQELEAERYVRWTATSHSGKSYLVNGFESRRCPAAIVLAQDAGDVLESKRARLE